MASLGRPSHLGPVRTSLVPADATIITTGDPYTLRFTKSTDLYHSFLLEDPGQRKCIILS